MGVDGLSHHVNRQLCRMHTSIKDQHRGKTVAVRVRVNTYTYTVGWQ